MTPSSVAERLIGARMPPVTLKDTDGKAVALDQLSGCTIIYVYPRTSPQDGATIPGWDKIPGAVGCTPQSCGFRDHFSELKAAGAEMVYGLSVQDSDYQREVVERLHLPFPILSDEALALRDALDLPVIEAGGMILLERMAMIVQDGIIQHVLHPVTNPAENAADVVAWLHQQAG